MVEECDALNKHEGQPVEQVAQQEEAAHAHGGPLDGRRRAEGAQRLRRARRAWAVQAVGWVQAVRRARRARWAVWVRAMPGRA